MPDPVTASRRAALRAASASLALTPGPVGGDPGPMMKGRNGWTRAGTVSISPREHAAPCVRVDASSPRPSWNPALALEVSPADARRIAAALLEAANEADGLDLPYHVAFAPRTPGMGAPDDRNAPEE